MHVSFLLDFGSFTLGLPTWESFRFGLIVYFMFDAFQPLVLVSQTGR